MNLQQRIDATLAIMGAFGIPPTVLQSPEGGAMIIQTLLRLQESQRHHEEETATRQAQHDELFAILEQIRLTMHKTR